MAESPKKPSPGADFPNDLPDTEFGQWLRSRPISERQTHKTHTRPFHPYRDGPAIGVTIVALGLVVYWLAGLVGLR